MSLCRCRDGQTMHAAHAAHAAPLLFMQRRWSLCPVHSCPGLHLWPLGDSTHGNKSLQQLAQVRFMAALQSLNRFFSFLKKFWSSQMNCEVSLHVCIAIHPRRSLYFTINKEKAIFSSCDSLYHYFSFQILEKRSIILCVKSARSVCCQYSPHNNINQPSRAQSKWFQFLVLKYIFCHNFIFRMKASFLWLFPASLKSERIWPDFTFVPSPALPVPSTQLSRHFHSRLWIILYIVYSPKP